MTYFAIDHFLYLGMRDMLNDFRLELDLEKIRVGEGGAHIVHNHQVPFAYLWSPRFLPRPKDYGSHVDVTGTIFNDEGAGYEPPDELVAWLEAGERPIVVGFGSMMIERPQDLVSVIANAAKATKSRVLLQSSWSTLSAHADSDPALIYQLGNCPHDWLFQHVVAVVHHGGAGTTAAGLRAGRPTMICPFFGDQHLWAQAVHKRGVAVEGVPIDQITEEALAKAFKTLRGLNEE